MKKAIRFINKCIDTGLLILFLVAFLIGGYAMYDSYLVYEHANDKSLLKFRPSAKEEFVETAKELSKDVVAWLTLDDTEVNFPIMQGKTNSEYLNKDPYGKYSLSGSIFLDSRNAKDFSDPYNLIYGHHMDEGVMFGALDSYLDETFFKEHTKGTVVTPEKEYDLTIFATADTSAEEDSIFNPTVGGTLEYFKSHHRYYTEDPPEGAKLIALSTCKYPDTVDRTVLLGYMTEKGQSEQAPQATTP